MRVANIAGFLGIMLLAATAGAQTTTTTTAPTAQKHHQRKVARLGLDSAQKSEMKAVHEKYGSQNKADEAKVKADVAAWKQAKAANNKDAMKSARVQIKADRDAHKALATERRGDVEATLNPEQKVAFDAKIQASQASRAAKKAARKAGKGVKPVTGSGN